MPSTALAGTIPEVGAGYSSPLVFFMQPGVPEARLLPYDLVSAGASRTRDAILRSTIRYESMWANAVNIALTQVAVKAFELIGDVPLQVKRSQELLLDSEGGEGWIELLLKALQDFCLTDNGLFIEIERETKYEQSKVKNLWVLDSVRCWRTGNPKYPVIYTDIDGQDHVLEPHQVIAIADMPNSSPFTRGVGLCAAARAYKAILKTIAIERYYWEKITGNRPQSISFMNGLAPKQLEDAVEYARTQNKAKGIETYMGAMVVALLGDAAPEIKTIDFASLPDNFNREYEDRQAKIVYAAALGYSVDELEPQTGQALGVGAQSQTQMQRDRLKGLAALEQRLLHQLHRKVLSKTVTMGFVARDLNELLKEAQAKKAVVDTYLPLAEKQMINQKQIVQILAEEKVLPKTFLDPETDDRSLTDSERPETQEGRDAAAEMQQSTGATQNNQPPVQATEQPKAGNSAPPAPPAQAQPDQAAQTRARLAALARLVQTNKEVKDKEIKGLFEEELEAARRAYKRLVALNNA